MGSSKDPNFEGHLEFRTLNPKNGFNWKVGMGPDFNFFGGVITDNQIKQVRVLQNDKVHEVDIIKIADNLNVWYSIFGYEPKSISDEPDKFKLKPTIMMESFYGKKRLKEAWEVNIQQTGALVSLAIGSNHYLDIPESVRFCGRSGPNFPIKYWGIRIFFYQNL